METVRMDTWSDFMTAVGLLGASLEKTYVDAGSNVAMTVYACARGSAVLYEYDGNQGGGVVGTVPNILTNPFFVGATGSLDINFI